MSTKGNPQAKQPPMWVRLACGHGVLFAPPLPNEGDELTCGICSFPTEVVSSPRRWRTR